jgi:type III restriction enzyme
VGGEKRGSGEGSAASGVHRGLQQPSVSKLVFDYVAGWKKTLEDGTEVVVSGALALFSNASDGKWLHRPNTILVDSTQLESGEAMWDEFRRAAAVEIEEFEAEYRERYPGSRCGRAHRGRPAV